MSSIWTHRRLRIVLAGAATLLTAAALASAALAGLNALDLGPAAASQYPGKKVTVCHRTHSKKNPWVKIRISTHALKAHLRHGDFVVDANHPCPPPNAASAKKNDKHQGKGKHDESSAAKSKSNAAKSKSNAAKSKSNAAKSKSNAAKSKSNAAKSKSNGKSNAAKSKQHDNNKGGKSQGTK